MQQLWRRLRRRLWGLRLVTLDVTPDMNQESFADWRGFAFTSSGRVAGLPDDLTEDQRLRVELEASLRLLLETKPGDRPLMPEYGCAIYKLGYALPNRKTLALIQALVKDCVSRFEPRVQQVKLHWLQAVEESRANAQGMLPIRVRAYYSPEQLPLELDLLVPLCLEPLT